MTAQTPQRPQGGQGSLFVFDAYNFIFRAYHALPMLNAPDGTPVNAVHGFVRMVQAVRREFSPELMVAVFDAGGSGGRKEVYEEYKANRPPPPDDLIPQFRLVRDATDALGIPRIESDAYEADDVIAAYANAASEQGKRVVIVSSDKDLMQLVRAGDGDQPSIFLFDTMKNKTVGPPEVRAKFGVGPELLGDLLALTGDSSDNVPGVPGIGPKTAAALLTEHGDLQGVLAAAPTIKQKKRRERLIEHAGDARLSRELVELRGDVALPQPLEALTDKGVDDATVIAFFEPLGFTQVLKEVGADQLAKKAIAGDDGGAVELVPVSDYTPAPERYRVLMSEDAAALAKMVKACKKADLVALDVVTSGDESLVPHVVGIAMAAKGAPKDAGDPTYIPMGHQQADLLGGKQLDPDAVVSALRPVLEDEAVPKVAFDHKSVAHALTPLGLSLNGVVMDPMLASYVIDPARSAHSAVALAKDVLGHGLMAVESVTGKGRKRKVMPELSPEAVKPYACERVEVTLALGQLMPSQVEGAGPASRRLFKDVEMPLSDVLLRIEQRGIVVDVEVLAKQSVELTETITSIQARVEQEAGYAINLDSPIQLRKLLFDERGLPPTRKTKTGYSTDAKALEELSLLDPIVKDILEYRSVTKLKNTYLDALPKLVRPQTGRLHTSFHQAVAATGRLSSSDPNLQNIPIRTAEGRRIREAFVAPPGRELVALDYSQIELRILAHLSGDPNLKSAFVDGVDVHRRTASEVFGVAEDSVDAEQRRIAKAVNFGVVYGQTAFGLAQQLSIPRGKAGSYIRAYFEKVPGVDAYMRHVIEIAKRRGYAETILGRRRRIPELGRKGPARAHGERMARNTPIQGSAADILKLAMIEVDRQTRDLPWAAMLLTVHDELIFECELDRVEELISIARPVMEKAVELSVPLQVDAGHGRTWAECKG